MGHEVPRGPSKPHVAQETPAWTMTGRNPVPKVAAARTGATLRDTGNLRLAGRVGRCPSQPYERSATLEEGGGSASSVSPGGGVGPETIP